MKTKLEEAIALATEAHAGQRDKAGQPYILHPLRVMFRLTSETDRIVGVLHDVVEDTATALDDLRKLGFSEEILRAVDCVTQREGEPREEYAVRYKSNAIARRVKLADLEDNMDVRRISEITEKDRERLNRYLKVYGELQRENGA